MNKYNPEEMVAAKDRYGKDVMIPRSKAVRRITKTEVKGQSVALTSDRFYLVAPDGSFRSTKSKLNKAERKAEKKNRRLQKQGA